MTSHWRWAVRLLLRRIWFRAPRWSPPSPPRAADDLIRPIARDGAAIVEVAIKLQRSLGQIAAMAPQAHALLALRAADALMRCGAAMQSQSDLECVRAVYRSHWTGQDAPSGH